MTNGSSFLPEGMSMDAFIEQASYEELMQAYRMLVVTADSPDDHTSQEMATVINGMVDKIVPDLEAEFEANNIPFNEENFRNAVLMQHVNVSGPGMMSGPAPLDQFTMNAMAMAPDIDTTAITELTGTIRESNETWKALEGTLGPNANPSAFIGTYVDARMQVWEAENTIAELGPDADPAALAAAQTDLAVGQALHERIDAAIPEDMRGDAEEAFASAQEATINPPGTMLSRGLSSVWEGFNDAGYSALAGGYNLFVDDENHITAEGLEAGYTEWATGADAALSQAGSDLVDTIKLGFSSDPEDVAEFERRLRDGSISLVDGVVDGVFELGGMAAGLATWGINERAEQFGFNPVFSEENSGWNMVDTVSGLDDAGLSRLYGAFGYEMRTDGSYGLINGGGSFIGIGGPFTKLFGRGAGLFRASDEVADGVRNANRADNAPTGTPRPSGLGDEAPTPNPHTPSPAEVTAEAGARTGTAPKVVDEATSAGPRQGNMATRTVAAVISRNSPRGIYRSSDSAADRLMRLSRAEEKGLDTNTARRYMDRLINQVGRGDAKVSQTELTTMRSSGQFSDEFMGRLDNAMDASRSPLGQLKYQAAHTFSNPLTAAGTTIGLAKNIALAPLTAARWTLSSKFKFAAVSGAIAADTFALDGTVRDTLGDAFGSYYRGLGTIADTVTGIEVSKVTTDFAAAAVDPDQTIAGTLADNGNTGAALIAENTPVLAGGEHTPLDAGDADVATADPQAEVSNASASGPAARNGDGELSIMGFFNDAVAGIGIDFDNMDMVNYAQMALVGFAAFTTIVEGNPLGGVIMGAMAVGLRPAMKVLDDFAESQGIDLMPDQWHTPESNNAYGGLGL